MTRAHLTWLVVLVFAVIASGVGVVYAKNQSRALFVQLQKVRADNDRAVTEWGRLQLELANKGGLENVVRIAGGRLKMHAPNASDVVVVD